MAPPVGTAPDGPIDFVLLWVDGNDPAWQASKRHWQEAAGISVATPAEKDANGTCRYNDNGLLRYWFRAVERFAPWVRRVFFVTCGQRPPWLDDACPRLRVVSHSDFMPAERLPVFHAPPIHFSLPLIPDLAERFVLFDDDMFLLQPVTPSLYFRDGLPVLFPSLILPRYRGDFNWLRNIWNDFYEINSHLDIKWLLRQNAGKWFNPSTIGFRPAFSNFIRFLFNSHMPVTDFGHLPLPHLKSTFGELWRQCPEAVDRTVRARFRANDQVCQWRAVAWNLATGRFSPAARPPPDKAVVARRLDTLESACSIIRGREFKQVCINEFGGTDDPSHCYGRLREAFEDILPGKSSFERD